MEKFLQIAPHSLAIVLGPAEGPAGQRSEAARPASPAGPQQLSRHHIGYEIFADFKAENMQHFWNKKVTAAVAETFFLGWIDEQVLLIQGKEEHLEALREGWSRRALRPPSGFHIRCLGESGRRAPRPVPPGRVRCGSAGDLSPPCPSRCAGRAPPGARASLHPRAAPGEGPAAWARAGQGSFLAPKPREQYLCAHGAPGRPAGASLAAPAGRCLGPIRWAAAREARRVLGRSGSAGFPLLRSALGAGARADQGEVETDGAQVASGGSGLSRGRRRLPVQVRRRPRVHPVRGPGPGRSAPPPAASAWREEGGGVGGWGRVPPGVG